MKVRSLVGALASVFSFRSSTSLIAGSAFFASIFFASTIANATTYTYDDGDFGTATQTTIFAGSGTPATVTMPCASCGTSATAGILVNIGAGTADTAFFIGEPSWIYSPATQGALLSISGSIDRAANFTGGGTFSNTLRLAVQQGTNYYFMSLDKPPTGSGVYSNLASGPLTAANFGLYILGAFSVNPDLSQNPDFSQPFELGYLLLSQSGLITSAQFDNLHYQIDAAAVVTPLPGALPLFASGGALLGFLGWRRRKVA
jgi:hypothetical protein